MEYLNTCNYKPHYGEIVNLCVAFKSLRSTFSDIISSDAQNNPVREFDWPDLFRGEDKTQRGAGDLPKAAYLLSGGAEILPPRSVFCPKILLWCGRH